MGYVYVLRPLSDDKHLAQIPHTRKIGFMACTVEQRIASADRHATFRSGPVEDVAACKLPAAPAATIEGLLHRLFASPVSTSR